MLRSTHDRGLLVAPETRLVARTTHYRKHYTPLYVAEACWKYNERKTDNAFCAFMQECFA